MSRIGENSISSTKAYHAALYLSDSEGEDDDVCVWKHGPPSVSDFDDSETETLIAKYKKTAPSDQKTSKAHPAGETNDDAGNTQSSRPKKAPSETSKKNTVEPARKENAQSTEDGLHEQAISHDLSSTLRYVTRLSQFVLKDEVRAGKATKEGIRKTLDATVAQRHRDRSQDTDTDTQRARDHRTEIAHIHALCEEIFERRFLLNRSLQRRSRAGQDAPRGQGPPLHILGDGAVKAWLRVERRDNKFSAEATSAYTVADLADGRSFRDWVVYLRKLCAFGDRPRDEEKLVRIAWLFVDRGLRGPRPEKATKIEDFVLKLEEKHRTGAFAEALKSPKRHEEEDEEAWSIIRKSWSMRAPTL
ncbi:hypothetical protein F5Y15DRAFT_422472 [Xylariaceae sp. FL0016]|nr:hypothetical protein F5Y15DRAFT_422472 [Xylariaceae sp. FL0016]